MALWQNIGFVFKGECTRTRWIVFGFAVETRSNTRSLHLIRLIMLERYGSEPASFIKGSRRNFQIFAM